MFNLNRENIFPEDDLGIQNAMKEIYVLNLEKKELKQKMRDKARHWEPYRTLACMYLWKYKDKD
jgi:DNA-3-methyladenine glycosylase II